MPLAWRWEHPAEARAAHCFVDDLALCGWGRFTGRVGPEGFDKCPGCVARKRDIERHQVPA